MDAAARNARGGALEIAATHHVGGGHFGVADRVVAGVMICAAARRNRGISAARRGVRPRACICGAIVDEAARGGVRRHLLRGREPSAAAAVAGGGAAASGATSSSAITPGAPEKRAGGRRLAAPALRRALA